jgi:hypothetical protein
MDPSELADFSRVPIEDDAGESNGREGAGAREIGISLIQGLEGCRIGTFVGLFCRMISGRWHPSGMRRRWGWCSSGVVAALLNHRLIAVNPPGSGNLVGGRWGGGVDRAQ